mgnify:CR=1 FL=1
MMLLFYCCLQTSVDIVHIEQTFRYILIVFSVRFCRFCVVIRFFLRLRRIFYPRFYPLPYFRILILLKEPVFPYSMIIPNKGTTGTIFMTSLVWRGPLLGTEPGTSRTRSQHSTTRLSRRRLYIDNMALF